MRIFEVTAPPLSTLYLNLYSKEGKNQEEQSQQEELAGLNKNAFQSESRLA